MTDIDLDALAALAEAATPNGWPSAEALEDAQIYPNDAALIAALDPATVTGLIQRVRECDAHGPDNHACCGDGSTRCGAFADLRTALDAAQDEIRNTAERIADAAEARATAALGPFPCCDCCPDDPDYHADNPKNSHSTWCTSCHADPARLLAAEAERDRLRKERDLLQVEVNHWIENDRISFERATRLDNEITALRDAVTALRATMHEAAMVGLGAVTCSSVRDELDALLAPTPTPTADTEGSDHA